MADLTLLAAILPVFLFGFSIVIEKKVASIFGNYFTGVVIISAGLIPIFLAYLYFNAPLSQISMIESIISGVLLALGFLLYYRALETEQVSNTGATGLAQPAIIVLFSILVLGEALTLPQAIGGVIIISGVFLVVTNNELKINRKLLPAILANISWAGYWIFATYAILGSNQVGFPLLISRITAVILALAAYLLLSKKTLKQRSKVVDFRPIIAIGILGGILDGLGNTSFAYVVKLNLLYLASLFNAGVPLLIAGLGYFFYKDKLTKLQLLGIGVAIIGGLILATF